ncbi:MAG: tail fiber domain-containing protein [Candidatus Sungbacteria bacterium]|nr:tail fiber domain-containing protein [Candidatus Sungbacteria bacterium]
MSTATYSPTAIYSIVTDTTSFDIDDLVFATRAASTDTAPSERVRITSGGNVGIGTTSPSATLAINPANDTRSLYIDDRDGTPSAAVATLRRSNNNSSPSTSLALLRLIDHSSNYPLSIEDYLGNSLLVVRGSGNVGIGTTSPGSLLSVHGNSLISGTTTSGSLIATSTLYVGGTTGSSLYVSTSGNVGIGTTGPVSPLHVFNPTANTSAITIVGGGGSSQSRLMFSYGTAGSVTADTGLILSSLSAFSLTALASQPMTFTTGGSERVRITNDGNVGIGTTSPATLLEVSSSAAGGGVLRITNQGATQSAGEKLGSIEFYNFDASAAATGVRAFITPVENDSGTGRSFDLTFGTGSVAEATEKLRIDKSGNVGIGTTGPGQELEVNGQIRYVAATADNNTTQCRNSSGDLAGCTSLLQWKEHIEDLSLGLDTVLALRPVSFDWKSASSSSPLYRRDLGFIAEEVASTSPLLARWTDQGMLEGVRYSQMTALMAKAIQELNFKVEQIASSTEILRSAQNDKEGSSGNNYTAYLLDFLKQIGVYVEEGIVRAKEFIADRVRTKELCVGETCVNEDQLKKLLEKNQVSAVDIVSPAADVAVPFGSISPSAEIVLPSGSTSYELDSTPAPVLTATAVDTASSTPVVSEDSAKGDMLSKEQAASAAPEENSSEETEQMSASNDSTNSTSTSSNP